MWFIKLLYWLQLFFCPIFLLGFAGFLAGSRLLLIILLFTGAIAGIIAAEYVRRKYGLSEFFSNLYSSSARSSKNKGSD